MKVGIIGGNGFVGSGIRKYLESQHIDTVNIELENYERLTGSSFDVLVNANGNSKKYLASQSPKEDFRASVQSVEYSLVDFKCGLYVYCSSVDVYPDHEHPGMNAEDTVIDPKKLSLYGFHKSLGEQLVQRYAARWLVLRFGGFVGEGLKKNSIYDILHGAPLRVHVDSQYQYLSTASAGEVLLTLIQKGIENEVFNVCGDGCVSLREITNEIPKYPLQYAVENPPLEHYEVCVKKLLRHTRVSMTRDTVFAFIRAALKVPGTIS